MIQNNKLSRISSIFWISNLQYFLVQIYAGFKFKSGFSLKENAISDLGNTVCGIYSGREVCSPEYLLMNASFIIVGVTTFLGALFLLKSYGGQKSRLFIFGVASMTLSGIGTSLAGFFPENTIGLLHVSGAALAFIFGNLGFVLLANSKELNFNKFLKYLSTTVGLLALSLIPLLTNGVYLGLGFGGLERAIAYPQTVWLISFGLYSLFGLSKVYENSRLK